MMPQVTEPPFCDSCSRVLTPGQGEFYIVRIEAVADPTPPVVADEYQDPDEIRQQISVLFEKLNDLSEQEAMDQVFRRVVLYLCNACYGRWIENPTSS
jgi:hypothetical protein